jgi:Ca-activated chloride channel family protein
MNARDLVEDDQRVNRLDVVKDVFADFIIGSDGLGGRPDDLVGLVTFAGFADSVCPLTLDHANLASIAKDLSVVNLQTEDGTAIGDGLGLAVERLRRSKAKSRVAILLTDGVNNSGVISPKQASELAKEFDIKVYAIGAGTDGYAPIPVQDAFGRTRVMDMRVEIDEETLQEIADETGGKYFRAQDADALLNVYAEIDRLERTEVAETRFLKHNELFAYPVGLALIMLGVTWGLNNTYFRRLP